jgi:glyoxylase-like metal-dependent hydrolase (beta-lactamase superfamily II)
MIQPLGEFFMAEVSRRNVVLGAAGAYALFGLDKPVEFIGFAQAQKAPGQFLKYKVGSAEVFSLHDGEALRPSLEGFVKNVPLDQVKAALKGAGLADDKLTNYFTMTALKMGGKTILIDSGTGGQLAPTAGTLMANMAAAGIDPKSVNTILVSHFHPDHIFGLMAKDTNAQIFPNAEILVPDTEYAFWTNPASAAKIPEAQKGLAARINATFPTWKNLKQFAVGAEVLPGIKSIATYGHTPGHTSFVVGSGKDQLLVQGDVSGVPYLFVKNPGWHSMFDLDAAAAEASRRALYERAIADKAMIAGYHWGFPNAGTLAKDGNGYAFTAIKA